MQLLVGLRYTYMKYSLSPATRKGQNAAGPVTAVFLEEKIQPDFLHQGIGALGQLLKRG